MGANASRRSDLKRRFASCEALGNRTSKLAKRNIIAVREDRYLIRGDNTYMDENVPDGAVIGVLAGFQRKGREHTVTEKGYLLYARFWTAVYPLRRLIIRSGRAVKAAGRKLGIIR